MLLLHLTVASSPGYREQERIAKAEAARRETERILREQQAEVDAKKADMVKRDIQREKVSLHCDDDPVISLYMHICRDVMMTMSAALICMHAQYQSC